MNKEQLQEAIEAVSNINKSLYEQLGPDNTKLLYVIVEPYIGYVAVEIGEYQLWNSEEDDREWEERDYAANGKCIEAGYESLEPYLRRKVNELIESLNKIKL